MVVRFARSAERQCGALVQPEKTADDKRIFQCPRCEVAVLEAGHLTDVAQCQLSRVKRT